jgi:hypothetical protein
MPIRSYETKPYFIVGGGLSNNSAENIEKYAPRLNYWPSRNDDGKPDAINHPFDRLGSFSCTITPRF